MTKRYVDNVQWCVSACVLARVGGYMVWCAVGAQRGALTSAIGPETGSAHHGMVPRLYAGLPCILCLYITYIQHCVQKLVEIGTLNGKARDRSGPRVMVHLYRNGDCTDHGTYIRW